MTAADCSVATPLAGKAMVANGCVQVAPAVVGQPWSTTWLAPMDFAVSLSGPGCSTNIASR